MAPRKRKAPEKKARPFRAVLLSSTALFLGQAGRGLFALAWRHPRPVLTAVLFAGAFGAIAANALWYQPHRIESPYLVTRDISHFSALPGLRKVQKPADNVTTFKIERQDADTVVVDEGVPPATGTADAQPATPDQSGLKVASLPIRPVAQPENVALAVAVQQALINKGLYDGVPDGVIGPRTSAAILFYEQTVGLPETGEVSEKLLQTLMADGGGTPPAQATPAVAKASPKPETDPVAAAIKSGTSAAPVVKVSGSSDDLADLIRQTQPAKAKPATEATADPAPSPAMVKQIQKGLIKMSYPDVDPDGVAGSQTRAAIRQFEKYYGLPVTGEPSAKILAKMQEIGAV